MNPEKPSSGKMSVTKISFDEIKNNPKIFNELNKKSKSNSIYQRSVYNAAGFYYDDSDVLLINYGDYKTYTFQIYRLEDVQKLENLVIREDKDGMLESYIFTYDLDNDDMDKLINDNEIPNLTEKINVTSMSATAKNGDEGRTVYKRKDGTCFTTSKYKDGVSCGTPDCYYIVNLALCPEEGFIDLSLVSDGGDGGDGGNGSGGGSGGSGSGGSGGSGSGSGGSGGGSGGGGGSIGGSFLNIFSMLPVKYPGGQSNPPNMPGGGGSTSYPGSPEFPEGQVITKPVINLLVLDFKGRLSKQQTDWLKAKLTLSMHINSLISGKSEGYEARKDLAIKIIEFGMANINNLPVIMNVLSYLEENDYINDEIIPAKIAIEDIQNNIVAPTILNLIKKPCQKQIVNDLMQVSSPFLNTINQTFNTTQTVNMRFSNRAAWAKFFCDDRSSNTSRNKFGNLLY